MTIPGMYSTISDELPERVRPLRRGGGKMMTRCEGWRRHGGVFTLGPVVWEQCKNDATVMIKVEQDGKVETLPACPICWNEAIDTGIKILDVVPIERTP